MTAQPSQTRIWNSSLTLLGSSKRISSPTDTGPAARIFASHWDETRDEVLADHPWNEAVWRANLSESLDYDITAQTEYEHAFLLPVDCLRWLPWQRGHKNWFEGEQEGRYLLCNEAGPLYIRYIRRIEDMATWSPGLRAAIAAKLAAKSCKAVTGSSRMIAAAEDAYEGELAKAKRQDGLATGKRQRGANWRSTWNDTRNRPWSGGGG